MFSINVNQPAKNAVQLEISGNLSITAIKAKIEENLNVPTGDQRLFFRGQELEDEKTASAMGIEANSTLTLTNKIFVPKLSGKSSIVVESETINKELYVKLVQTKSLTNQAGLNLLESKIGGIPFIPYGMALPKTKKGENVFLLCQLNMAQMPHLPGFPADGILQFYTAEYEECIACDNWPILTNDKIHVKYWKAEHVDEYIKNPKFQDYQLNAPSYSYFIDNTQDQKQTANQLIDGTLYEEDYNDEELEEIQDRTQEEQEENDEEEVKSRADFKMGSAGCKIGGIPVFIQYPEYTNLVTLLQLDSEGIVMIGQSGVLHFFISEEDLKHKDFDKVIFQFDCY